MAKQMIVAGVMSGTSADGVDVAICRITPPRGDSEMPRVRFLGHAEMAYSKAVKAAVLSAMDAKSISVAELSRLNWRLGELFASAIERAQQEIGVTAALVGCHGQTIYHQGIAKKYLGTEVRATWQIGEAAVIAERLRCPVVSDFRPADLAAKGQGAPLVPMLDFYMFRSKTVSRVLQNLGGIGNLTVIPAGVGIEDVMAFDTGPGNMVIDGCMRLLYGREFDRNGAVAQRGRVLEDVVTTMMKDSYFSSLPPKSCGREEFGAPFATKFIEVCRRARKDLRDEDVIASATAFTAASIVDAYRRFVWAHIGQRAPLAKVEFVVAGGGTKNKTLMNLLQTDLSALGVRVRVMDDLGIPAQAKEGVAFALMAWLSWWGLPGNVPTATGARRPAVLGKVSRG